MAFNQVIFLVGLPIISGIAAVGLIMVLTPLAALVGAIDEPDDRKHHAGPTPMVGGFAIYLVLLAVILLIDPPEKITWIMAASTLLLFVGFLDDAFDLGVKVRFLVQIIAVGIMVFGGNLSIQTLGFTFLGMNELGLWGLALTCLAVVGLTNAFNMVDGIDGLASGHLLIGMLSLIAIQLVFSGEVYQLTWLSVLLATVFAFWLVNMSLTPLRKVFLGDAGSLLLGFLMSWLLIYYSQDPISLVHPVAALWCVTLPVYDTVIVIMKRLRKSMSPFQPDRNHLHHLLIDAGVPAKLALFWILAASVLLNVTGIVITYLVSPIVGLIAFFIVMLIFAFFLLQGREKPTGKYC
ncbi:undecaprenyl/decaprenyl-phosphate alpha-N-acetylglucosaminyl 1-phosphate transferase [Litorivicinus sp.]|nr:undecaprenyl/decaprenyl-phosphate alpha-N-acetylglucosaminyl 1-phosphate transferase [Litorivicinus sp.]